MFSGFSSAGMEGRGNKNPGRGGGFSPGTPIGFKSEGPWGVL